MWGIHLSKRSLTRSFDVFFDLRLNKRLNKQSRGWWFETPSHSLWRHCNAGYNDDQSCSHLQKYTDILDIFQTLITKIAEMTHTCKVSARVKLERNISSWTTYEICRRKRFVIACPLTKISPVAIGITPMRVFNKVDFPAPAWEIWWMCYIGLPYNTAYHNTTSHTVRRQKLYNTSSSNFIPSRIQKYNTVCMTNITNSRVIIDIVMWFCWWPPEKSWAYQAGSHQWHLELIINTLHLP